ncbi:hypothetical protein DESACE_07885 [Desulfurella acetivorans A63]|nr:hypothetical protein DESACE_07885 [Desulfurella acetivorans A63]
MSEVKALSEFLQNGHTKFEVVKIEGGRELRDYLEQEGILIYQIGSILFIGGFYV